MMVPKRTLDDIRFQTDIVDLIGSYITVKRSGSTFKALCPFHKEKTPSFHVNPQRQIFHCFGCGEGGDVFSFLMKHEGVEFMMAVRMLAQRAGIELQLEEGDGDGSDKATLFKIHQEIAQFYRRCLLQMKGAEHARRYLAERELAPETLEGFMVGYAPNRWDSVLKWGEKHKFKTEQLEEAGLILKSQKPNAVSPYYDRFRDRLMFPILDGQSRVIGFSGRALKSDEKSAKYVNSPETPLFKKSRILYAMDKARRQIVDAGEAIVCEGQIDVIRCHQAGFKTAVAAQGTAFTEDHARILARYADGAVIVFDTDQAGQDAAIKTSALFMATGLAVRVAALPESEDPDSFIRARGADAFQKILDSASSAVDFQISVLSTREKMSSEIGVMRVAKAVLKTVSHSPNAVQRAKLVQEAASRLNLPPTALQDDLRFVMKKSRDRAPARGESAPTPAMAAHPKEEIALCEHMVRTMDHPELADLVDEYLPLDMLASPMCRAIIQASIRSLREGIPLQQVLHEQKDESGEFQRLAAQVQMAPTKIKGVDTSDQDAVKDLILYIWRRALQKERTSADDKRRSEITFDLKALKDWEHGADLIKILRI